MPRRRDPPGTSPCRLVSGWSLRQAHAGEQPAWVSFATETHGVGHGTTGDKTSVQGAVEFSHGVPHLRPGIHVEMSGICSGFARGLPFRKDPAGAREVTGIAARHLLKVVLMFWLGFPEVADGLKLSDNVPWPQTRRVHVKDRLLRHLFLLVARIEDRRTVACAYIVALTVPCCGIVDLEEILE